MASTEVQVSIMCIDKDRVMKIRNIMNFTRKTGFIGRFGKSKFHFHTRKGNGI